MAVLQTAVFVGAVITLEGVAAAAFGCAKYAAPVISAVGRICRCR